MTRLSDDSTSTETARDAYSAFRSQATAVIAHLTKTAQSELNANQDLRQRLADAEALNAAHCRLIERLETDVARAKGMAETRELTSRMSDDKVMVLGTALTAAQRTCARHEALIADLMASRAWRAGAPWRGLGRLWARTISRRALRRALAGHFDALWFVREYPGVRLLDVDPFAYFMAHGLARDLNPNPCFDMRWYLRRHPDVASLGLHPLVHFQAHGFAEGRDPHPDVSCAAYRARYDAGWAHAPE